MELRWLYKEGTTTEAPRLQYRIRMVQLTDNSLFWGEWMDVPSAVATAPTPKEPTP